MVSDTSLRGWMAVPRDVMPGYELMGAEAFGLLAAPPTHIFLQTGVGGMAAAIAAQAKRRWGDARPTIILLDPDKSARWPDSITAKRPVVVERDLDALMAGLACGEALALAWAIVKDNADAAMALSDEAAVRMMRALARPDAGDPPIVAG
jgi:diaminopropionate ammonia-lyase